MDVSNLAVISEAESGWRESRQKLEARLAALAPSYPGRPFRCTRVAVEGRPATYFYVPRAREILRYVWPVTQ